MSRPRAAASTLVGLMNELLELLASPWNFLWVLVVFGFAPGFCLRLIIRLYPADHPRRRELLAELYAMKRSERPIFVMEQLETAIFEGIGARKHRRSDKNRTVPLLPLDVTKMAIALSRFEDECVSTVVDYHLIIKSSDKTFAKKLDQDTLAELTRQMPNADTRWLLSLVDGRDVVVKDTSV